MDYIPFPTSGEALQYALRHRYGLIRKDGLDTPILMGVIAQRPDETEQYQLHRTDTHYEWRPL